jgi:hypothetical protein
VAGRIRKSLRSHRSGHRTTEPWALKYALGVLLVGAVVAILVFTLTYWAIDGEDKDRFDVGIKAATATAAIVAGILTWGRLELSRYEHRLSVDRDLTERYGRAVDQLCKDETTAQIGGVFAMERFALDAIAVSGPDRDTDWRMAIDLLADFARQHATTRGSVPADACGSNQETFRTPVDPVPSEVVAAVRTLGRFAKRASHPDPTHVRYNLNSINLAGVDLHGESVVAADLVSADFSGSHLHGTNLTGADCDLAVSRNAIRRIRPCAFHRGLLTSTAQSSLPIPVTSRCCRPILTALMATTTASDARRKTARQRRHRPRTTKRRRRLPLSR